jgi:hypothetical protein
MTQIPFKGNCHGVVVVVAVIVVVAVTVAVIVVAAVDVLAETVCISLSGRSLLSVCQSVTISSLFCILPTSRVGTFLMTLEGMYLKISFMSSKSSFFQSSGLP